MLSILRLNKNIILSTWRSQIAYVLYFYKGVFEVRALAGPKIHQALLKLAELYSELTQGLYSLMLYKNAHNRNSKTEFQINNQVSKWSRKKIQTVMNFKHF